MKLSQNIQLDHLEELIQDSPSSQIKLLAAWDGLTIETQINILIFLNGQIPDKLKFKILQSKNSYIRFLVVKKLNLYYYNENVFLKHNSQSWIDEEYNTSEEKYNNDIKPIIDLIKKDEASIVRGAILELNSNSFDYFLSQPLEQQLIALHLDNKKPSAFLLEKIIDYFEYVSTNPINNYKLSQLIEDHLKNPTIIQFYLSHPIHDYYSSPESLTSTELLEKLWNLFLKVSHSTVGQVMATYLPVRSEWGRIKNWNNNTIKSIDRFSLLTLLYRKEITLSDFRKDIIFKNHIDDWELIGAALSSDLNLTFKEFDKLLASRNFDLFSFIIGNNRTELNIKPIYLYVLSDILRIFSKPELNVSGEDPTESYLKRLSSDIYNDVDYLCENIEKLISKFIQSFSPNEKLNIAYTLSIYNYARKFTTWDKKTINMDGNNRDKWLFLINHVIPGDPWKTFVSFYGIFEAYPYKFKDWLLEEIKNICPSIYPDCLKSSYDPALYATKKNKLEIKLDLLYQQMNKIVDADNSNALLVIIIIFITAFVTSLLNYYLWK